MPIPTVAAVGAVAAGTTAAIAPAIPPGTVAGHVMCCFCETGQQPITTPAGWGLVGGAAVVNATGLVTDLTVFWKRAVGGDTAPSLLTTPTPQDHISACIISFAGCVATGSPFAGTPATGLDNVATATAFTIPGGTTNTDNCLVVACLSTGFDVASTAFVTGWTNASLGSLTERIDNWTANGNGGGFAVATGTKNSRGAYSATTGTVTSAGTKAFMSFALQGTTDPFSYVHGMSGSGPFY